MSRKLTKLFPFGLVLEVHEPQDLGYASTVGLYGWRYNKTQNQIKQPSVALKAAHLRDAILGRLRSRIHHCLDDRLT